MKRTESVMEKEEKLQLLTKETLAQHSQKYYYIHIGLIQVAVKPLTRLGLNTSALVYVCNRRLEISFDSLVGMVEATLRVVVKWLPFMQVRERCLLAEHGPITDRK